MGGLFSSPKPAAPAVTKPAEKVNILSPTGSTTFGTVGAGGEFTPTGGLTTQKTTETPFQEQFRLGKEGLSAGLLQQLQSEDILPQQQFKASDISSKIPQATTLGEGLGAMITPDQFGEQATSLEQATFERGSNLLSPEFDRQRARLEQDLANQGIDINSKAGQDALNRLETSQGGQLENLALSSVAGGRAEQDRLAKLGLLTRGQGIDEQRALLSDALNRELSLANLAGQQRATRFGEIGSLSGLTTPFAPTPIATIGQAGGTGGTAATPAGAGFGLLGKLGSAAIMASDVNLKENIKKVDTKNGFNIYEFEYKDKSYGSDRYRGVMAQEVENVIPEAVKTMANGFKAVYYDMIGIKMETV